MARELVAPVFADSLGRFTPRWLAWARRITVRQLRDDVEGGDAAARG